MYDIFISYAREDRDSVATIVSTLESQGWVVFWDPNIKPGQHWNDLLESALNSSKAVIVVWTQASVKSYWVKAEATAARERGVLVPVRLDGSPVPLPFGLIQAADLSPSLSAQARNAALEQLLGTLGGMLEKPAKPAQPLTDVAPAPIPNTLKQFDWMYILFNLDGRLSRKEFWVALLVFLPVFLILSMIVDAVTGASASDATLEKKSESMALYFLLTLYPSLAVAKKRLHDINRSGWWAAPLLILAAFSNIIAPWTESEDVEASIGALILSLGSIAPSLILGFIPGTRKANTYGAPRELGSSGN